MIDKDFERRVALLTNDGYFSRAWELSKTMTVKEAWIQVELELPHGLRRYTTFTSFTDARKKNANKTLPKPHFKGR